MASVMVDKFKASKIQKLTLQSYCDSSNIVNLKVKGRGGKGNLLSMHGKGLYDEENSEKFYQLLCEWYHNFGKTKDRNVTYHSLKKVGLEIAKRLKMVQLPSNWYQTLKNSHGVKLVMNKSYSNSTTTTTINKKKPLPPLFRIISHQTELDSTPTTTSTTGNLDSKSSETMDQRNQKYVPHTFRHESIIDDDDEVMERENYGNQEVEMKSTDTTRISSPQRWLESYKNDHNLPRLLNRIQSTGKLLSSEDSTSSP